MPRLHDCLYCGVYYIRADSEKLGTSPELATIYCSPDCREADSLAMAADAFEPEQELPPILSQHVQTSGGFTLKIPVK